MKNLSSVSNNKDVATKEYVDGKVPTNNNQLTNGAGYQTASDVASIISSTFSAITNAEIDAIIFG